VQTIPGARFCHQCGRQLDATIDGLRAGDRRVVTALFADLVGYTRLVDELDPEEVRARVDGALGLMGEAAARFGGSVEKFVGDAVLAVFGAPTAHDDDALRACLCALEMQAGLARDVEGDDHPFQLRIGLATGEVVAAPREVAGIRSVALTGGPMTTAARLQQGAEPGEILLDEATVAAAEPRIGVERAGECELRGQRNRVVFYRLRGERRVVRHARRHDGPLVGREAERARLCEVLHRTTRTGKGGAVLVRGEAGIGKSRLLSEVEAEARGAGFGWTWIDNAPHGMDTPYRAVRAMVDWLADERGVKAGILGREMLLGPDLDEASARLVLGAVAVFARDSEMTLLPEEGWDAELAGSVDPAELTAGLRFITQRWVSRMVAEQPRVVVIDDYHWLDGPSRDRMDEMVAFAADLPLVVLTGARPPVMPAWVGQPHVEVIELTGLDQAATEELGRAVAGVELEPASGRWLYERTAGNALFVGEIMRALCRSGRVETVEGRLKIDCPTAQSNVPLSLRALLGARIDALPLQPRSVLEVASVIGMTFPEWLLRDLGGETSDPADLSVLAEAGIIARVDEKDDAAGGSTRWRFLHQLFHDATYGRILVERRRRLHSALADRLETADPPVGAAELAHHRVAAGDVQRALPLLERAAVEAGAVGAVAEAEAFQRMAASLRGKNEEAISQPGADSGQRSVLPRP
jgi:adenylate cyclase